jgi:hypothetical protein
MSDEPVTSPGTPLAKLQVAHTGEFLDSIHPARAAGLEWARSQVGLQDPDLYWDLVCPALKGKPHDISWCGGFALAGWVENLPGCKGWTWEPRKGFLIPRGVQTVNIPEPFDIALWRYINGKEVWHYALVEDFRDGKIYSIDGNQGIRPQELVEPRTRTLDTDPVFYSARNYLE